MKKILEITLNLLNRLDSERISLVIYDPVTFSVTLRQHGNVTVRLNQLIGYFIPYKRTGVLLPADLAYLKDNIKYLIDHNVTYMVAPIKGGYRIWEAGDTAYTSKPRHTIDLKFYSYVNWISILIGKLMHEEVSSLFRIIKVNK